MNRTMFERYGGFRTVRNIVSAFYEKTLESEVTAPYFENTDMRRLLDHQSKFVASLMGGPASYTNDELRRIHARIGIDDRAFETTAGLLEEALEDLEVAQDDIEEIMEAFTARRPYIVTGGAS